MASIRLLALLWILSLGVRPAACAPDTGRSADSEKFVPGETWLDTRGRAINAHGGGMLYHKQTYYWYGENKAGRSWMPEGNRSWDGYRVDVTGIRCYSSKDLYRWKDRGLVLKAVAGDPSSDLHISKVVERPKVAFNPRTGKF
ncbi:MAG: glycoside hydrolase family 43 protein, partial [Limisphaerales bacterium]